MLALATTAIAWVLLVIMVVGWIVYAALNAGSARRELGSEIEARVGGWSSCSSSAWSCSSSS